MRELAAAALMLGLLACTGPLVDVPAAGGGAAAGADLAVLLSGDGGWAAFDEALAAELAGRGIPVLGVNSVHYFWRAKTPEAAAADLEGVIASRLAGAARTRVLFIGYSFGGDAAPFLVNRFSPAFAAKISVLALIAPTERAAFELKVLDWLGLGAELGQPVAPELARVRRMPVLCLYGKDDAEAICRDLRPPVEVRGFEGGHRLTDKVAALAAAIVAAGR